MHFDSKHDLFHAIRILQHFKISISEVYTPEFIPILEKKLRVKQIRRGFAFLKYGCIGGATTTTLLAYLYLGGILDGNAKADYKELACNIGIMVLTFIVALYLFPSKVPKIKHLKRRDQRYLVVLKSDQMIDQHQEVTQLMKYAQAVELSPEIKNMIAC